MPNARTHAQVYHGGSGGSERDRVGWGRGEGETCHVPSLAPPPSNGRMWWKRCCQDRTLGSGVSRRSNYQLCHWDLLDVGYSARLGCSSLCPGVCKPWVVPPALCSPLPWPSALPALALSGLFASCGSCPPPSPQLPSGSQAGHVTSFQLWAEGHFLQEASSWS